MYLMLVEDPYKTRWTTDAFHTDYESLNETIPYIYININET